MAALIAYMLFTLPLAFCLDEMDLLQQKLEVGDADADADASRSGYGSFTSQEKAYLESFQGHMKIPELERNSLVKTVRQLQGQALDEDMKVEKILASQNVIGDLRKIVMPMLSNLKENKFIGKYVTPKLMASYDTQLLEMQRRQDIGEFQKMIIPNFRKTPDEKTIEAAHFDIGTKIKEVEARNDIPRDFEKAAHYPAPLRLNRFMPALKGKEHDVMASLVQVNSTWMGDEDEEAHPREFVRDRDMANQDEGFNMAEGKVKFDMWFSSKYSSGYRLAIYPFSVTHMEYLPVNGKKPDEEHILEKRDHFKTGWGIDVAFPDNPDARTTLQFRFGNRDVYSGKSFTMGVTIMTNAEYRNHDFDGVAHGNTQDKWGYGLGVKFMVGGGKKNPYTLVSYSAKLAWSTPDMTDSSQEFAYSPGTPHLNVLFQVADDLTLGIRFAIGSNNEVTSSGIVLVHEVIEYQDKWKHLSKSYRAMQDIRPDMEKG